VTLAFTEANFLALIKSAEGTPYLYGGTDPFHGGADCSGLIYWAGLQCGVTLPRTTTAEWAALPHSTDLAAMPVGGCVEFEVPGDGGSPPQHVGVNVGGGFMIDDPETGMVVQQQVIPNEPGIIWPIGWVALPFVAPAPAPVPPLPLPIQEETMSLELLPNGTAVISAVGAGSRAEHLLVFTLNPTDPNNPDYNVLDVTDGIGTADPYTVVSA